MRRAEQGFTLIEVLVALVMASVLIAIIADGAASARARQQSAAQHEDATRLARTILTSAAAGSPADRQDHGSEGALDWTLTQAVIQTDQRGIYALVELRVDVAIRGKRLESFTTRHLDRVALQ